MENHELQESLLTQIAAVSGLTLGGAMTATTHADGTLYAVLYGLLIFAATFMAVKGVFADIRLLKNN